MDDGIPKKIGRYVVDRLLGSGAMGFVFLGRDPELDRAVAIKTVRDLNMDQESLSLFLERFRNEARAAARLHHPNIVQVYDVGEDDELGPFLVFEYVAGSTLKQILRSRGALDALGVVRLAEEIGEALTLAHEEEIIHRDIKPDNLLVTPEGQTKLADFGVARIPNAALTREGQFLGTPCYAAPETLKRGDYGIRSDLFSFAAVLYEAAAGRRAFPGDDAVAVAHMVIHDEPEQLRQVADDPAMIPPGVERVIMRALSKEPTERPTSAAALAAAVRDAYLTAGFVDAEELARPASRRIPLPSETQSGGSGGGGGLVYLVLLAAVVVLGIGLIFVIEGDDDPVVLASDAGPADSGPPADGGVATATTSPTDGGVDLGVDVDPDLGPPDLGVDDIASMTPHEREEAAKDALDRARSLLEDGDAEGARAALGEATRYDPGNPDIGELRRAIDETPPPP
jgi:serine/threonine-protein kinase